MLKVITINSAFSELFVIRLYLNEKEIAVIPILSLAAAFSKRETAFPLFVPYWSAATVTCNPSKPFRT